ncbi:hypothetical protein Misp01_00420 [Microtetraspora sp. NBRC 13810]|uniref:YbaB/EbfC family nucleoid-associated protein n=1 Tax=Microtetraspora sp. NBRC 13810 TaxID=3030990 RepID=UPI0024A2C5AA|nr:YbaB/EbfC family nucleoid-associated protein [Microtetraspora sp. NBRC 13810]GLW04912.1 hypothetical protein Misp01_00420 [Microtetraspora sp. NBRC 13810]
MAYTSEDDQELLDRFMAQSRRAMRRLKEAEAAAGQVVGEGHSADGLIQVTADGQGHVTQIKLDPRVLRLDRPALGTTVLAAIQQAQADGERKSRKILGEALDETSALPAPLDESFVRDRVERVARELLGG